MLLTTVVALMSASSLPDGGEAGAPDWIQLLPAGKIKTVDGRGPYSLKGTEKMLQDSMDVAGGKLVLDENHSTDAIIASPARAAGWITELAVRDGGVWGKVQWTSLGKELIDGQSYRGISPVVVSNKKTGVITGILRAALTNNPNLRGMAALHNSENQMENNMDFLESLIAALGLEEGASEDDVLAAVKKALESSSDDTKEDAVQADLQSIASAVGDKVKADPDAIVSAIKVALAMKPAQQGMVSVEAFSELQDEVVKLTKQTTGDRAEAFVDAAIKDGKVGVKGLRDHYIERHSVDPEGVEKELDALPSLTGSNTITLAADTKKGALSEAETEACIQLGVKPEAYKKTLEADNAKMGAA